MFLPLQSVSGIIVEGNHIYTTLGGCSENALDIKIGGPQQSIIRRNRMYGFRPNNGSCGGTGGGVGDAVVIHEQATNLLIKGNEIYDSTAGVRIAAGSDYRIINNVIHDIAIDRITGPHDVTTGAPALVSASTADYHLGGASAAIDAGAGAPTMDRDGNPRPFGAGGCGPE